MSAEHDRKFFDTFMLILGILAAITIGLMVLAGRISDRTSKQFHDEDPRKVEETLARIAPVGRVAVAGQDNTALAPPAAAPTAAAVDLPGEQVYQQVCTACHGAGVAGAPKTGDKAAWAPRIAQGIDLLHKHSLEGLPGQGGLHAAEGWPHGPERPVGHERRRLPGQPGAVNGCLHDSSAPSSLPPRWPASSRAALRRRRSPTRCATRASTSRTSRRSAGRQAARSTQETRPLKLLDANIRAAVVDVMKRKGYVEAPAGTTPDLRIAYETAKAEKLENNPVRVGIGVGSWGGNMGGSVSMGSPSVRNFTEGTLVVHAIDTARNVEVWQGRVSGKMTKGSVEAAAIHQAVAAGDGGLSGTLASVLPVLVLHDGMDESAERPVLLSPLDV